MSRHILLFPRAEPSVPPYFENRIVNFLTRDKCTLFILKTVIFRGKQNIFLLSSLSSALRTPPSACSIYISVFPVPHSPSKPLLCGTKKCKIGLKKCFYMKYLEHQTTTILQKIITIGLVQINGVF